MGGSVMKRTLYELTERYEALLDLAYDESDDDGLLSPEFTAMLSSLEGDIEAKADGCCRVIRELEAHAEACAVEAERLSTMRQRAERHAQRLREYVMACIGKSGVEKLRAGTFQLRLQNNPLKVVVLDEAAIPNQFWKPQPPKLSMSELGEALKSGVEVPGVQLTRGTHLRGV